MDLEAEIAEIYPSGQTFIIKCFNCHCLFDYRAFEQHICDYNENNELIVPDGSYSNTLVVAELVGENLSLINSERTCLRLLRDNRIRIQGLLRYTVRAYVPKYAQRSSSSRRSSLAEEVVDSTGIDSNANKRNGPYQCTQCERKFVYYSGLLRHIGRQHPNCTPGLTIEDDKSNGAQSSKLIRSMDDLRVVNKCTLCGRLFFDAATAFSHMCTHLIFSDEREQDNTCEVPYEKYLDDAMSLLKIRDTNSDDGAMTPSNNSSQYLKVIVLDCMLQCEFCDFFFSEVSYLLKHSAYHSPERRFECNGCGITMRTSKECSTHWNWECLSMRENSEKFRAPTKRFFVCNVCCNKFPSIEQLHEHRYIAFHFFPRLNRVLGCLQLPCECCDAIFEKASECAAHYAENHCKKLSVRQYLAKMDGNSVTDSSQLSGTLSLCRRGKSLAYQGAYCMRKFVVRSYMKYRLRKFHFKCTVCAKHFTSASSYYHHRIVNECQPNECEDCGKRFYYAPAFKYHRRKHINEKPFSCLFCDKNFRERATRNQHIHSCHLQKTGDAGKNLADLTEKNANPA